MTQHYYFMPMERIDLGEGGTIRGPKYFKWRGNPTGIDCPWSMIDYGMIDLAFVSADTTIADHQQIFDAADTLSVDPRNGNQRNLNATAAQGEIDALTAYLDTAAHFVPMGWATVTDTRRAILRGVCGIFMFVQRVTTEAGSPPTEWGITLATTWAELTDQQRAWMRQAALTLGFPTNDPPAGTTMRQVLRFMGNNWGSRPIYFGSLGVL